MLSFKERIAIRTNVVDWILTTPNIAFDYDVVHTPYDKKSVGINLKYNWNTNHTYVPKLVYNLFDLRLDYRFYWRQQLYDDRNEWGDWEREWLNTAKGLDKLRARANCFRGSDNPKQNVSFFVGPYLSATTFSFRLNPSEDALGRQGTALGGGLTGGIAMPLYGYENGSALDLEIGGSIGWHFASYDFYSVDVESNCYHAQGHSRKWTLYPLVTDARVSLVYRFRTIAKQHKEINYDLLDRRYIALAIKRDRAEVKRYNASIKKSKNRLDKRNQEIALYKQTVELAPGFNAAYRLEYLTPYAYMMEVPRKYTRHNKDTLPKIEIDSINQINDRILLSVRNGIDSIPHVTSSQIDAEFVKLYNNISNKSAKVNRTELIKEIYSRLNTYLIKDNNDKLFSSTFSTEVYTEKVRKFEPKQQKSPEVEITYRDSVRIVEMSDNEKIEWRNSIKKKAWYDAQNRTYSKLVKNIEITDTVQSDSLSIDSVKKDSVRIDDVNYIQTDTIATDTITADSIVTETTGMVTLSYNHIPCCILEEWEKGKFFICLKEEEDEELFYTQDGQ